MQIHQTWSCRALVQELAHLLTGPHSLAILQAPLVSEIVELVSNKTIQLRNEPEH